MDMKKTGLFIAALRQEQKLTQKELAEKLEVTDKAVSHWETGKGFPDISLLEPLSKALEVSVTELMNGERATPENVKDKADSAILETWAYFKKMHRKVFGILFLVCGVLWLASPAFLVTSNPVHIALPIVGLAFIGDGVFLLVFPGFSHNRKKRFCLSRRAASIISALLLLTALVLETLPSGVVMRFAVGPGESVQKTVSYFDLSAVGYGLFFPFLTALLTAALAVLFLILFLRRLKGTRLQNAILICTAIALVLSLLPLLFFGTDWMSPVGIGVSLCLFLSGIFQGFANRHAGK